MATLASDAPCPGASWAGERLPVSMVVSDTSTPSGSARARSTRARRRRAKSGSGSTGVTGERKASKGSGIVVLLGAVGPAKRAPGPHEQAFGGVHAAVHQGGDVGDGK